MHRHGVRRGVVLRSRGAVGYVGTVRCNKYVQSCQILSIVIICLHDDDNALYARMSSCPIRRFSLLLVMCNDNVLHSLIEDVAYFELCLKKVVRGGTYE